MFKEKYIYVRICQPDSAYEGIRCATEDEHKSDARFLIPGEKEINVMSIGLLENLSHEEICDEIITNIFRAYDFSEAYKEYILEDVRLLAEGLL